MAIANTSWNGNTPKTLRVAVTIEKNIITPRAAFQANRSSLSRSVGEEATGWLEGLNFPSTLSLSVLRELDEPLQGNVLTGPVRQ